MRFLLKMNPAIKLLILIFTVCLIVLIRGLYQQYKLNKDGVYVIGKRTYLSLGEKNATYFRYKYFFHEKEYTASSSESFSHAAKANEFLYIRILPYNPSVYSINTEMHVPKCSTSINIPLDGWKVIPFDICNQ